MGNFGSQLRAQDENDLPPPDYEPDNDRVTVSFRFRGKIHEGAYIEEGLAIKNYKYDHVPVSMLGVGMMRLFAKRQVHSDDFNLFTKERGGLKHLVEDSDLFTACGKLEKNFRELVICIVMKAAIDGDVGEVVEGTDEEDSLAAISEFSDSDEEYEFDMDESEESEDDWMDNVFETQGESSRPASARRDKGKEKVTPQVVIPTMSMEDNFEDDECINDSDEDLNTARDSDDEGSNRLNCQTFNQSHIFDPKICIGMIFTSKQEMKMVVQSIAINDKRTVKFKKNDLMRLWAECADVNCHWMVRGLKLKNEKAFQVSKYNKKHSCNLCYNVKNMTSTWLAQRYLDTFRSDPKRDLEAMRIEKVQDLKVHITEQQIIKAKRKAFVLLEGKPDTQYELMHSFVEEIKTSNPGSTVVMEVDGSDGRRRFDRVYICLNATKSGFKEGCRPVLCFDGCWLKGVSGGCLLTCCGIDGNNSYLPIAWAVVRKECTETWSWFMTLLKHDLQIVQTQYYTLMSEKQKGLIQAELDVF